MREQLLLVTATIFFYIIDRTLKTSFSLNPQTILFVREGAVPITITQNNNFFLL